MIHGYTYRFVQTYNLPDRAPYWTKPPALSSTLKSGCDVTIMIDADAIFTHLALPFEWLLNRWRITPTTALSMALDPHQDWNKDSHGRVWTNAGFIVANNLPRTHEMLKAWSACPEEKLERYKDCARFKHPWPAEQGAFAEYIRYQFAEEEDVREIPCTEANGYPGGGQGCEGVFLKHFWNAKDDVKAEVARGVTQPIMADVLKSFREERLLQERAREREEKQGGRGKGKGQGRRTVQ